MAFTYSLPSLSSNIHGCKVNSLTAHLSLATTP
jgi:hypothetical protein